MLLDIELAILVEEVPGQGGALLVVRAGISLFKVNIALLNDNGSCLRVHGWKQYVSN